ncbi:MAG: 50S ribosomal protein L11 methyltransferase [Pseudomonadota bacterium]
MPTCKATLIIPHREEAERIAELLETQMSDEETPIALWDNEAEGHWTVDVYREGLDATALADDVREALGSDGFAVPIETQVLDEVDWVTASLEGLDAVRAGRFVVHGLHARDAVGPTDIGLRVEASRAFGTGHHGTTLGCLELINWVCDRTRPTRTLDLGTGTGVLAMAVAKRAKQAVLATDIDPVCVEVTAHNVTLNSVAPWVRTAWANGVEGTPQKDAPYDLIVANILAGPLIALARPLCRLIAYDGRIILSGLMRHQERVVRARYRHEGFVIEQARRHGEWSALLLKRP